MRTGAAATIGVVALGFTPFTLPTWIGSWFEMYSTWETLGAQLVAALFVVGSYYLAEYVKVRRPQSRGEEVRAQPSSSALRTRSHGELSRKAVPEMG